MNLLRFGTGIVRQVVQILVQRKKEYAWAAARLQEIESQTGVVLPDNPRNKVMTAYSIYQPMVVDAFAALRGRKSSEGERFRMLQYFICSSTFDDFTDEKELTADELYNIAYRSETFTPKSPQERMFLQAHTALKNFVHDAAAYESVTRSLFKAQVDSSQQTDPALPDEEVYRITISKGAYSVLLCNFYMDNDGKQEVWAPCWFMLGGIIQLTNDLFDTWKDLQVGLQTLPTRMKDAEVLYQRYITMVDELDAAIAQLPVPERRKRRFRMRMMAICSFSDLALQQLRNIQLEHGSMPDLRSLPRKALIVDMEKMKNIWHCMRFTYRRCRQA